MDIKDITTNNKIDGEPTCCTNPMQRDGNYLDCLTCWSFIELNGAGLVTKISIRKKPVPTA